MPGSTDGEPRGVGPPSDAAARDMKLAFTGMAAVLLVALIVTLLS
jgi:hypothetical protein